MHLNKASYPKFKFLADSLGLANAKAAENKYYKLKKAHWDTVGGAELVLKGMSGVDTSTSIGKADTPKSKKHQLEANQDDDESPAKKKGKGSAKKVKAGDGDDEAPTKMEPKAEDDFT
ncbi:hypothetical protein B0A54_12517 [Friedmanniomyces endolithicus]|uniref:Uncharacterized protein n=1 Tax=Friedmanniomyces endolithicus TaxID=329885 RepID=A0A4U0UJH2_9PEZI|nr:hypothetical protein B0A54_12517 [Friedmanniomyces endolithicus]